MEKLNLYEKLLKVEEIINEEDIIKFLNKDINILENKIQNRSNMFEFDSTLFEKYDKIINDFYYKKNIELEKIDKEKVETVKNYIKINSKLSKFQNIENEDDFIFIFYFLTNDINTTLNILFLYNIDNINDYYYIKKIMDNNNYNIFLKNLEDFFDNLNLDIYLKKKLGFNENEIIEKKIIEYFNSIKKILNLQNHSIYDDKELEKKFNLLKLKKLDNNSNYLDFWNYYEKNNKSLNALKKKIYPLSNPISNPIKINNLSKGENHKNLSFIKKNIKIIEYRKHNKEINKENNKQNYTLNLYKNEYMKLNNELIQMEKNINLKKTLKNLKNLQIQINLDKNNYKLIDRQKIEDKKLIDLTFNNKLDLILQRERINKIKDKILNLENNINKNTQESHKNNRIILEISKYKRNDIKNKVLNNFKYFENQKYFYNRKKHNLYKEKIIYLNNHKVIKTDFNELSILNNKKQLLLDEIEINKIYINLININLNNFLEKDIDNEINILIKDIYYPDIINEILKKKIKLLIKKKLEFLIYIFILKYKSIDINDYINHSLIKNIKNINIKEKFNNCNSKFFKNINIDMNELNHNQFVKQKITNFKNNVNLFKREYNILSKFI